MSEKQNIEYKQSWNDEYLKWVCGFANAQGGKLFIGIDDKGDILGVSDYKKLMEDVPNKIVSHLGLVVDVNLHEKDGKYYIEVDVPQSIAPISYKGAFHYRSGSTKQELKGIALQNWLLKKTGKHWENLPVLGSSTDDIDLMALKKFVADAVKRDRIPVEAMDYTALDLLDSLNLTSEGHLTNAALLLFGKR
ncbi:MAG: ATP-dependent DNA helicase, partial [Flavobacterium sp.]